jgi:hypothetical protein
VLLATEKGRAAGLWFVIRISKMLMSVSREGTLWAVTWLVALALPYPASLAQLVPSIIHLAFPSSTPAPGCFHDLM